MTNLGIGFLGGLVTGCLYWLTFRWPALHRSPKKAIRLLHPVLIFLIMVSSGRALSAILFSLMVGTSSARAGAIYVWLCVSLAICIAALIAHWKEMPKE